MIIAFTGKKRSGKSTACEIVGWPRVNFKNALVAEIKQNFPTLLGKIVEVYSHLYPKTVDDLFVEKEPFVRALLQNYGTEVRRRDDPEYWVKRWKESLPDGNVLVDDVRFLNEAKAVRDAGGIVVRIVRADMESTDTHASETEMDLIVPDYTIETTTGDFEGMRAQLDAILKTNT